MAATFATVDSFFDSTNGTSWISPNSYIPLANKFYRWIISQWGPQPPTSVTPTAFGLTWLRADSGIGGGSTPDSRVEYWYAWSGSSPSSGTASFSAASSCNGIIADFGEWSGLDSSGTIVQHNKLDSYLGTNPTVTLSSGITGNNPVDAGFFNYNGASIISVGGSYSTSSEKIDSGDGFGQIVIYKIPGTTTPNVTYGSTPACGGVAVELKESAGGGGSVGAPYYYREHIGRAGGYA